LAPSSYCSSLDIANYALYIVGGQLAFGLLLSMLGYSAGGAWDALFVLQFAHLIQVMNITAPSCGIYFYQLFRWANLQDDSISQWMRHGICIDGEEPKPPIYNMY
jgi:hypothetical protein